MPCRQHQGSRCCIVQCKTATSLEAQYPLSARTPFPHCAHQYHYWFYSGEAHATRRGQTLGHQDLPQFVGDISKVPYRPVWGSDKAGTANREPSEIEAGLTMSCSVQRRKGSVKWAGARGRRSGVSSVRAVRPHQVSCRQLQPGLRESGLRTRELRRPECEAPVHSSRSRTRKADLFLSLLAEKDRTPLRQALVNHLLYGVAHLVGQFRH